jgi:hypothetical protein
MSFVVFGLDLGSTVSNLDLGVYKRSDYSRFKTANPVAEPLRSMGARGPGPPSLKVLQKKKKKS